MGTTLYWNCWFTLISSWSIISLNSVKDFLNHQTQILNYSKTFPPLSPGMFKQCWATWTSVLCPAKAHQVKYAKKHKVVNTNGHRLQGFFEGYHDADILQWQIQKFCWGQKEGQGRLKYQELRLSQQPKLSLSVIWPPGLWSMSSKQLTKKWPWFPKQWMQGFQPLPRQGSWPTWRLTSTKDKDHCKDCKESINNAHHSKDGD